MSSMTENVGLIIVQACFASTYSGQTCRAPASICALLCPGSREAQSRLGPHSPAPWAGSLYGLWHGFWTMDSSPSKSGVTLLLVFEGLHFYLCSSFMVFVGDKRNIHILMYGTIILAYTWVTLNITPVCGLLKIHCTSALILRKGILTRSKICPC